MNAKEFRIGNFVFDDENEVVKVENIMSNRFVVWNDMEDCVLFSKKNDSINMFASKINPIPLTEEWLLKFGFVEEFENKFYKNSLAIEVFENECIVYLGDFVDLAIKYVHDLQNLYFSITREELELSSAAQHGYA